MCRPISPKKKIAVTLRFLASSETFHSLYLFWVHRVSMDKFVPEAGKAIYDCLKDEYLKILSTTEEWESAAEKTNIWHFPNAFAADGIIVLALVDYHYKLMYIDVGCQGRMGDVWVYNNLILKAILTNSLKLPSRKPLPNIDPNDIFWYKETSAPFLFVANDVFPLSQNIMKPYPQRNLNDKKQIFCYRLSNFRR